MKSVSDITIAHVMKINRAVLDLKNDIKNVEGLSNTILTAVNALKGVKNTEITKEDEVCIYSCFVITKSTSV